MPQRVRMQRFFDPAALRRQPAGMPNDLFGDRRIGGVMRAAGEQPDCRFSAQPAIMLPQFVEQARAEHDITVPAAFPVLNMENHAR